ncbi:sulfate adenylyltransferase subunit 1 [Allopusillimonas ginsengisoli]|uniref:sulfate adenylyltransferase subunit 1 n=1 Tax=Allopusillimonas ginsengisoli TaxID=453575 RepID=UPI001020A3B2|nr:GTP-binding protein [Allopusillimonas ginsengisoli]TEA77591.1 sulfate adenylyltransferase [Allopusillimonas ginsengisoli]
MNAINEQFIQTNDRSVLRFITAGSVDDGKSTLIGRLLFDSKTVFADQLRAIERSRYRRPEDLEPNLAMLTDGLEDEREQGITIDLAYRYFSTPKRKFIVADAPGHEQYTRNMVTGASTAHAAIILVDASKARDGQLLVQTRRHSTIAHLLGVRHIIVAVNKLDLLDWNADVFQRIEHAYTELAKKLGIPRFQVIPVSALLGDNIVRVSGNTPWYRGPTLLTLLETLEADEGLDQGPLRFLVQWVARHNGSQADGLRGYAGQVASGTLRKGDEVIVQPSGVRATVKALLTFDAEVEQASAGVPVTVLLNEHIDISRGDWLSHSVQAPTITREFEADLCWLGTQPLNPARKYLIKHGAKTSSARVADIINRRDLQHLVELPMNGEALSMNDIGRVAIRTRDSLAVDGYDELAATGAFILIDEATHLTVAGGLIRRAAPAD